ncbi:MAG: diaminopimelate decarboxylase [Proteobacteria bacterium]|nr:diaminopimelate decarboxylase [Pseudomonadota bacterium]
MAERKPYQAPLIEPLTFTAVSKHLAADILPGGEFDEDYDVADLLDRFGSPLFIVSESTLRSLYRGFRACFTEASIDTRVAYSYKTNYLPAICAILHEEGAWAEVVSGMEYSLARALGVPAKEIVFNGPYKKRDELETALGEGAIVNVDGFDDLAAVAQVAATLGRPARMGIRINFRHGPAPWTKFGFNDENGDSQRALEQIAGDPNLALELLHNHSGTFLLFHDVYAKAADVLIDAARRARELGLAPTTVNFGGGYPSTNRLKPAYDVPGGTHLQGDILFPFAEAICSRVSRAKELFGGRPILMLEPGRALVDSAVQLACTVIAKKDIPGQGKALVVDAGVNLVPTAYWYDHKVDSRPRDDDRTDESLEPVNIYGPLCMQIDILRERALLPPTRVGEPIVISNVGAYCQTQSMQFIQPRPATVLLGPEGPEVIRRRETWRDVFLRDAVPQRLRHHDFAF